MNCAMDLCFFNDNVISQSDKFSIGLLSNYFSRNIVGTARELATNRRMLILLLRFFLFWHFLHWHRQYCKVLSHPMRTDAELSSSGQALTNTSEICTCAAGYKFTTPTFLRFLGALSHSSGLKLKKKSQCYVEFSRDSSPVSSSARIVWNNDVFSCCYKKRLGYACALVVAQLLVRYSSFHPIYRVSVLPCWQ